MNKLTVGLSLLALFAVNSAQAQDTNMPYPREDGTATSVAPGVPITNDGRLPLRERLQQQLENLPRPIPVMPQQGGGMFGDLEKRRQEIQAQLVERQQLLRQNFEDRRAELQERFTETREEAQRLFEARREEFSAQVEARREEAKKLIDKQRAELKDRLETVRDSRKKQLVQRIDDNLKGLNSRLSDHFTNALNQIADVLSRIDSRTDKAEANGRDASSVRTAITAAEAAITAAREAVAAQAGKVYGVAVESEATLRDDTGEARQALHGDLKSAQEKVKAAREAVRQAAVALAQIPNVDSLSAPATSTPSSTNSSTNP